MKKMEEIKVDVRGISSAYIADSLFYGIKALAKRGYKLITLEENARLRLAESGDRHIWGSNFVAADFFYLPNRGIFLTMPGVINPKNIKSFNPVLGEFILNPQQLEEIDEYNSLLISKKDHSIPKGIPTNRFAEDDKTVFAFGNYAKRYGELLRERGVKSISINSTGPLRDKPYARKAHLGGVSVFSRWGSDIMDSNNSIFDGRVRGIKYL